MALSTETSAQRQRLLEALQKRPITTVEARSDLDVMHPAGRIRELRRRYKIATHLVPCGEHRLIARYCFMGELK